MRYLFLICWFLKSTIGLCQNIDSAKIECTYRLTYLPNPSKPDKPMTDVFHLLIGDKISFFYSYSKFLQDSMFNVNLKNGTIQEYLKDPIALNKNGDPGFYSNYTLLINYPEERITVKDQIVNSKFIYEESIEKIAWQILDDTMTILGYHCQKAKAAFRGRSYEAWFSQELPISSGPYKFGGLPGLIIKIEDVKKNYIFECLSVNNLYPKQQITIQYKDCIKTTRLEFRRAFQAMFQNPWDRLNESGGGLGTNVDKLKVMLPNGIPYNPIELE